MSYREDFYRMLEGKTPVSDVPYYHMGVYNDAGIPSGYVSVMLSIMANDFMPDPETGANVWGVVQETDVFGTGSMPKSGHFILTDVTKWRDVIKAPYDYDFDWEAAVEKDMAMVEWNPETDVTNIFGGGGGYFLQLASFMGFEGAMLALYDEPEAVHELLDYLCDFDCWRLGLILKHYKDIDVIGFGDDNATEINPFFSYEHFKEFFLPRYERVFKLAKEDGRVVSYHNCGRCEDFMDDFVDIGTQVWNCATPANDINAFKNRHDNKIICEVVPRVMPDASEEEIRQIVRDTVDLYAPGGAFVWIGSVGAMAPELRDRADNILFDEIATYSKGFYAK